MSIFDIFGDIEQIRPTPFANGGGYLLLPDVVPGETSCSIAGFITPFDVLGASDPVLRWLVSGLITGTEGAFSIAFHAVPESGSLYGQRSYQGAILPINPSGDFFLNFFIAGTLYAYDLSSPGNKSGHPSGAARGVLVGPTPFSITLPATED